MTYLALINFLKEYYQRDDYEVFFPIIFHVSKIVKNLEDFTKYRNQVIEFNFKKILKEINQYFYQKKPLGLILHEVNFCGIKFKTAKKVLVPRKETELLVESVLKVLKKTNKKSLTLLDLCCGSGCIGISLLKKCSKIKKAIFNDISKKAINTTKKNLKLNGFKGELICQDLLKLKTNVDILVCNPPYLKKEELQKHLVKYESKKSFNNGHYLKYYKWIINHVNQYIANQNNYLIAFEIGESLKQELEKILDVSHFKNKYYFLKDYARKDRILIINNLK